MVWGEVFMFICLLSAGSSNPFSLLCGLDADGLTNVEHIDFAITVVAGMRSLFDGPHGFGDLVVLANNFDSRVRSVIHEVLNHGLGFRNSVASKSANFRAAHAGQAFELVQRQRDKWKFSRFDVGDNLFHNSLSWRGLWFRFRLRHSAGQMRRQTCS